MLHNIWSSRWSIVLNSSCNCSVTRSTAKCYTFRFIQVHSKCIEDNKERSKYWFMRSSRYQRISAKAKFESRWRRLQQLSINKFNNIDTSRWNKIKQEEDNCTDSCTQSFGRWYPHTEVIRDDGSECNGESISQSRWRCSKQSSKTLFIIKQWYIDSISIRRENNFTVISVLWCNIKWIAPLCIIRQFNTL